MRAKGVIALLPLLVASGVTAACSSGSSGAAPAALVSNALSCGRVVDQDNTGYLGGPLTAGREIALLTGLERAGGAARISAGTLDAADRGILDLAGIDLLGYSGSKLSGDAAAFARAELSYSANSGDPVDTSYARPLESGIAVLAKDCPLGLAPTQRPAAATGTRTGTITSQSNNDD